MNRPIPVDLHSRAAGAFITLLLDADPDVETPKRGGAADSGKDAEGVDGAAFETASGQFRARLRDAIGTRSVESVAAMANVGALDLRRALDGAGAFDLVTVARLHLILGQDLWKDLGDER